LAQQPDASESEDLWDYDEEAKVYLGVLGQAVAAGDTKRVKRTMAKLRSLPATVNVRPRMSQHGDYASLRDRAEGELLGRSMFGRTSLARVNYDLSTTDFDGKFPALIRVERALGGEYTQGSIAQAIIREYQEWSAWSEEDGLAQIYKWLNSRNPKAYPYPLFDTVGLYDSLRDEENHRRLDLERTPERDLGQAFRMGRAEKARGVAKAVYKASYEAVSEWLKERNDDAKA
jgi:hypothetical protein